MNFTRYPIVEGFASANSMFRCTILETALTQPFPQLENSRASFTCRLLMLIMLLMISGMHPLRAQQAAAKADSAVLPSSSDSLPPPARRPGRVEGPVKYWADQISFSLPEQKSHLTGNVKIEYQNITLTAGKVDIDWVRNVLVAEGLADSTDAQGNPVYSGLPVLAEKGEEPIRGVRLEYDFKNNRGKVLEGRTNIKPGFYRGKDIRKVGEETLFIKGGYFTTCDLEEHPHYYFRSTKMRVRLNKIVIAKPVVLYIEDVPVMIAPFAVFSLKRGRRSGVILPTYGENSFGGRFLEEFGYYWAPNDYFDLTMLGSFFEKTGLVYTASARYRKRYILNGSVDGSYSPKDVTTGRNVQRWRLNFNHTQNFGQTLTLNGSGSFVSDRNYNRNYYTDFEQRTNQVLRTNVTLRKTLPGGRSLSANLRREENLQTDRIDYTFPDISFSQPSRSIFPRKGGRAAWYHDIRYSYRSDITSRGSRIAVRDSAGNVVRFDRPSKSGWQHQINPSFSTKLLKYFNLTPSVAFQELWVPEYFNYRFVDSLNTVVADTVKQFRARHLFTGMQLRTSTTMYGLWNIPFSPLKVIRHKMDPSIGFSYQPDYSDPRFGYYQTFRDTTGREIKRDRFSGNVFSSGTPQGEVRSLVLGLRNFFQGKLIRGKEEKKIDLVRVDFSTSHNFAKDSLRWSNIATTMSAKPLPQMNISMRSNHSFYKRAKNGIGRRNEFVWSKGFALPDLVDWNLAVNYHLELRPPQRDTPPQVDSLAQQVGELQEDQQDQGYQPQRDRYANVFKGFDMPWSVDVDFAFSYAERPTGITRRFDANINARLQLTRKWRVNYNSQLNITERDIVSQRFTIQRDLHCWEMNFTWSPTQNFSFYRLEIRVKESLLRDLKLTKTAGRRPF